MNLKQACVNNANVPTESNVVEEEEDEDEEVFFGPQTHKERIAAVVVKEQEAQQMPIESLTAEQQALLLRETALLSARIKHGTPGNAKGSPVAVVHPMPRNTESVTFGITSSTYSNKENNISTTTNDSLQKIKAKMLALKSGTKQSSSQSTANKPQILQPKFGLNKGRTSSQPEQTSLTKLPVARLRRAKIQSDMSEVCTVQNFSTDSQEFKRK